MSAAPNTPIKTSAAHRLQLASLADAMFPIDTWMNQKAHKPRDASAPWRAKYDVLDSMSLAAVDFIFDVLLASPEEEGADELLALRWAQLQAAPPDAYPGLGLPNWRRDRHLDPSIRFAPADSENTTCASEHADGAGHRLPAPRKAMSRGAFYKEYLPIFFASVNAAKPKNWTRYLHDALKVRYLPPDALEGRGQEFEPPPARMQWPSDAPHPSGFMLQFGRDLCVAHLSLRIVGPWSSAVLTEAGEHRRPANHYTSAEVEQARVEFDARLRSFVPRTTA